MGAVPKKKPSLLRSRQRRRTYINKLKLSPTVNCANCKAAKLPHRVCPQCGQYRGRQIVEPKTKVRKVS